MEIWNQEITALDEMEQKNLFFVAKLVGAVIERRKQLGWTQRDLADHSGVKQPVIARMESGASIPRIDTVFKVALAMGMSDVTIVFAEQSATIEIAS